MNERFFQNIRSNKVRFSVGELELPLQFYDVEAMMSYFPVATPALGTLLPSAELKPAQIRPGVSLLGLAAMEFKKSSIGAYNEFAVLIPCLWQPRTNWPLLPFLVPHWFPNLAAYALKLPVTTEFASIAGREIWGHPNFIAEIEFEEQDSHRICTLTHEGMLVLRYSLQKPTTPRYAQRNYPMFSIKGNCLLKTQLVTQGLLGVSKNSAGTELQFGRHPLAQQLSGLNPGPARLNYHYPKMQGMVGWSSKSYDLRPATVR